MPSMSGRLDPVNIAWQPNFVIMKLTNGKVLPTFSNFFFFPMIF